jgi:hypothetical protein
MASNYNGRQPSPRREEAHRGHRAALREQRRHQAQAKVHGPGLQGARVPRLRVLLLQEHHEVPLADTGQSTTTKKKSPSASKPRSSKSSSR